MPAALSTHEVQADVEGVDMPEGPPTVEFFGEEYRIATRMGAMPLLRYGHLSERGVDSGSMEGLAAMYAVFRNVIDPDDWPRFEQDAIEKRVGEDDLWEMIPRAIEILTARPTSPPSGSSSGRRATSGTSKASSSSPGTAPDDGMVSVDSLLGRSKG